jgi:VCBS repeat-containing protein
MPTYTGTKKSDTLWGSTGADTLFGDKGDDTYFVNHTGDVVVETKNQGNDLVASSISYTLTDNVEALVLIGTAALDGTGNTLNNILVGNAAANQLDGRAGADTMSGGAGDDTYIVDNTGDSVNENAGEGIDSVRSSVSYVLGANVENLTLTGTGAINATGNALANVIIGGAGGNRLSGAGGNDTLRGGSGNDVIDGGTGTDTAVYGGNLRDYAFSVAGATLTVRDLRAAPNDGVDTLTTIETLQFNDATIYLDGRNNAPIVAADAVATAFDTPLTIAAAALLANDFDPEGMPLTIIGVASGANGTALLNANGTITYTPVSGYSGAAGFSYTVSDGIATSTATVNVTVLPSSAPIAGNDTAAGNEDGVVVTGNVLANDTDPDGALTSSSITAWTQAANGSVTYNSDGTFTYTPGTDFSGVDTFTYTISDGSKTATATVSVTVNGVNDAPVAADDSASGNEGTAIVTANVLANDTDVDNALDASGVTAYTQGANGGVAYNGDGTFTYIPTADFYGDDSFTYTVTDGALTSTATVNVTVNAVNNAPVAAPDAISGDEDTLITTGNVLANDLDVDNTLSASSVIAHTQAANGLVVYNNDGTFSYSPTANFNGADNFTYTITDGALTSTATVAVTVHAVDDASPIVEDGVGHSAALDLAAAGAGVAGFKIIGGTAGGWAGTSVESAGDVNGDGIGDLIVGAQLNPAGGRNSGAVYVVFGKSDNVAVNLEDVAQGVGGYRIVGEGEFNRAGGDQQGVAALGDVNGDGKADLLVGARGNGSEDARDGAAYVVYGKADGASVALADVAAGTGGYKIAGMGDSEAGYAVGTVADMNGDGRAELLIGTTRSFDTTTAYVVFGQAGNAPVDLASVRLGIGGFAIAAEPEVGHSGRSIAGLGDVNGDGRGDFVIDGFFDTTDAQWNGAAYVVFGKAGNAPLDLSQVAAGIGGYKIVGENAYDGAGWQVASAGDVNGDGRTDALITAQYNDAAGHDAGAAYVVFGKSDTATVKLDDIANGFGGFKIIGETANDRSGFSVASLADVNGDGLSELIVAAPQHGLADAGAVYVVYGKSDGAAVRLSDVALNHGGFKLLGAGPLDLSAADVSGLGDLNGDGRPDILIGEPGQTVDGLRYGGAYVVFTPPPPAPNGITSGNVLADEVGAEGPDYTVVGVQAGSTADSVAGGVGGVIVGTYGTLTLAADGAYTYALEDRDSDTQALVQDAQVADVFSFTTSDALGALSTENLSIDITGTNDAPLASDSLVILNGRAPFQGAVTSVDAETASAAMQHTTTTVMRTGTIALAADGTYTYTPNEDFLGGSDQFVFKVTDAEGVSHTGSVEFHMWTPHTPRSFEGLDGNDRLLGSSGSDTFAGGLGDDVIDGGGAADMLAGGGGSDRFVYHAVTDGTDTIADFTAGSGGDVLDLRDVLTGYVDGTSAISDFVKLTGTGADTTLFVNVDGVGSDFAPLAKLGVSAVVEDMLAQGNLLV